LSKLNVIVGLLKKFVTLIITTFRIRLMEKPET